VSSDLRRIPVAHPAEQKVNGCGDSLCDVLGRLPCRWLPHPAQSIDDRFPR
jgi:hypothetical protein